MLVRSNRLATLAVVLAAVWPTSARAGVTYGPILGRGSAPDTMIVRWGTSSEAATELQVRRAGDASWNTVTGEAGVNHEVVVSGLEASALYEYVARSGGDEAAGTFGTCPQPGEPLRFVVYGDSRSNPDVHRALIDRIAADPPDLVLNTGDIVVDGTRSLYLSEFFPAAAELVRRVPYQAVAGNHDFQTSFAAGFGSVFPLPRHDDGQRRAWYEVRCGNTVFVVLDGNHPSDAEQSAFLDRVLQAARDDATVQHVFALVHQPPYSSGSSHGDSMSNREAFSARFADPANKVSAVFTGHDHHYERISAGGIVYLVTGGGGAGLRGAGSTTEGGDSIMFESVHHYVVVEVEGALADVRVIDDTGAGVDTFQVTSDVPDPPTPVGPETGEGDSSGDAGDPAAGGDAGPGGAPLEPEPDEVAHFIEGGCAVGRRGGGAAAALLLLVVALVATSAAGRARCAAASRRSAAGGRRRARAPRRWRPPRRSARRG